MHIEKNVCDNIIGTLLNIEGKTKDTVKTRMDLKDMGIRKELHLIQHGDKFIMPHACYQLSATDKKCFYQWLKTVKFLDGYASNISRCVNVGDCKISGMKSHDCHVFLQRLLIVATRGFVRKDVSDALAELSYFFSKLCSRTLRVCELEQMEKDIVIILCKLERIFPPVFFDVMVHLVVHLPREAILAGPVAFRWMYPIERFLHTLKTTVRNKARPEGSITEAYIDKECLTFCSMYLERVETKFNREERNCDGGNESKHTGLNVFTQNIRMLGAATYELMPIKDLDKARMYVLNNCEDVMPYVDEHKQLIQRKYTTHVEQRHKQEFPQWFENHAKMIQNLQSPTSNDSSESGLVQMTPAEAFSQAIGNRSGYFKGLGYGQAPIPVSKRRQEEVAEARQRATQLEAQLQEQTQAMQQQLQEQNQMMQQKMEDQSRKMQEQEEKICEMQQYKVEQEQNAQQQQQTINSLQSKVSDLTALIAQFISQQSNAHS